MRRVNLKIFRIQHNLTQSDMAERVGCSRDAYREIESGNRNPSYDFMEKFKEAFDVPAENMWQLMERER